MYSAGSASEITYVEKGIIHMKRTMPFSHHRKSATTVLLGGLFLCSGVAVGAEKRMQKMKGEVCKGFVVLSNGMAVMSGLDVKTEMAQSGSHGQMKLGVKMAKMMDHGKGHGAKKGHDGKMSLMMKDGLMRHRHGDPIKTKAGQICVPLHDQSRETWDSVSGDKALDVNIRSLRGRLDHNARDNESFELTVKYAGKPVEADHVRFFARMPHHDRMSKGGHGPANDPDVEGVMAKLSKAGTYKIQTLDFSMPGAWLFEVRVTHGGKTSRAYFASRVGQR